MDLFVNHKINSIESGGVARTGVLDLGVCFEFYPMFVQFRDFNIRKIIWREFVSPPKYAHELNNNNNDNNNKNINTFTIIINCNARELN